jgi:hypothetical protein
VGKDGIANAFHKGYQHASGLCKEYIAKLPSDALLVYSCFHQLIVFVSSLSSPTSPFLFNATGKYLNTLSTFGDTSQRLVGEFSLFPAVPSDCTTV